MTSYLLDSNVLSAIIKQPDGNVAVRAEMLDKGALLTSIIVACELRYGVEKSGSAVLREKVEGVLGRLTIVPLDKGVEPFYARLRVDLERRGKPIGANDLLIAAHALSLRAILVTDNTREFARVDGLVTENWLRD